MFRHYALELKNINIIWYIKREFEFVITSFRTVVFFITLVRKKIEEEAYIYRTKTKERKRRYIKHSHLTITWFGTKFLKKKKCQ